MENSRTRSVVPFRHPPIYETCDSCRRFFLLARTLQQNTSTDVSEPHSEVSSFIKFGLVVFRRCKPPEAAGNRDDSLPFFNSELQTFRLAKNISGGRFIGPSSILPQGHRRKKPPDRFRGLHPFQLFLCRKVEIPQRPCAQFASAVLIRIAIARKPRIAIVA